MEATNNRRQLPINVFVGLEVCIDPYGFLFNRVQEIYDLLMTKPP